MAFFMRTFDAVTVLAAQSASPGPGWTSIANVQAAFDEARLNGRPLFIRPGVYPTGHITVTPGNGGGAPLSVSAVPGTAALKLTGGDNLMSIIGVASCRIEGVIFDGANAGFSNPRPFSALLEISGADPLAANCVFKNSVRTGIYVRDGGTPRIIDNHFDHCSYAVWSLDSTSIIKDNAIENCANNAIMVWRSTVAKDGSMVVGNSINGVDSGGGNGQNGNGVNVYRAASVTVSGNRIFNCAYSAVRCNGGGGAIVSGNNIFNCREVAIFLEAPQAGLNFTGGVVMGNIIDTAGDGVVVTNSGLYEDGTARRVAVTGNVISNVAPRVSKGASYGGGWGIAVEGACVVSGNIIESAATLGIRAGTNDAAEDLNITGNTVLNSPMGIGWSNNAKAGQVLITSNQIRNAPGGGVAPVDYDGATSRRVAGSAEYGNQPGTQIGNAYIANNRVY